MVKRSSFILLLLILFLSLSNYTNTQKVKAAGKSPMTTIETLLNYQNTKKWESIPSLYVSDMEKSLTPFYSNQENQNEKKGIFNVKKAKLLNWKELSADEAAPYTYVKESAKYFYIAVDLDVFKDDKYQMNGTNYYLAALTEENGKWKIAQFSTAPVDILVANNNGFGSKDEKDLAKIFEKRKEGTFLNRQGNLLETNKEAKKEKKVDPSVINPQLIANDIHFSALTSSDHTQPSYISVYVTKSANGCIGCTALPSFVYYVENTLPYEWYSTWPSEALRTGALAVKMYGWYAVYYPLAPNVGCDVYDDTRSQVYTAGSSVSSTNQAISDMSGMGVQRGDNFNLFLTEYRAGSYGTGGKSGGYVYQYGSQYWADHGYNYSYILRYYYDGSINVGGAGKTISLFAY